MLVSTVTIALKCTVLSYMGMGQNIVRPYVRSNNKVRVLYVYKLQCAIVACGVSLMSLATLCCGSYDGVQGAGNRDYCAVATEGVSKRNPCWRGWRPAGGRGQCVYGCHSALESSMAQTDGQTLPIISIRFYDQ